jgi:hypothetical protein
MRQRLTRGRAKSVVHNPINHVPLPYLYIYICTAFDFVIISRYCVSYKVMCSRLRITNSVKHEPYWANYSGYYPERDEANPVSFKTYFKTIFPPVSTYLTSGLHPFSEYNCVWMASSLHALYMSRHLNLLEIMDNWRACGRKYNHVC